VASKHETVAAAVQTQLAAATTDVYPPDDVSRVSFFVEGDLETGKRTRYFLRPASEDRAIRDSTNTDGKLEMFLLVATRHTPPSEAAGAEETPTRWQKAADMVADVLQKLMSAGGNLSGVAIDTARGHFIVDYERALEGWALAEIRFVAQYRYVTAGR